MLRKWSYCTVLVYFTLGKLFAQYDPYINHFFFFSPYYNPASTGAFSQTNVSLLYRYQWLGYASTTGDANGSPRSTIFNFDTRINILNSGVGAYISYDQLGPLAITNAKVNYAYHLDFDETKRLSFGLGLGIYDISINSAAIRVIDQGDPRVLQLLANGTASTLDINTGVHYSSKKFKIGIGVLHINTPIYLSSTNTNNGTNLSSLSLNRSFILTSGYDFVLTEKFILSPVVLASTSPITRNEADFFKNYFVNATTLIKYNNDQLWGGLSIKSVGEASFLFGIGLFQDNLLRIGYSFDVILMGSAAKAGTSHEIFLSYRKPIQDMLPKPPIRTPRYRY
jgi:type IX secretion system PorP/SprF family membrane protein